MAEQKLLLILEQLQKSASTGRNYASDIHNLNRYEDILEKIMLLYKQIPNFNQALLPPNDKIAYVTPKVGVNAIIENEKGEILLEKRMDDKAWGVIGGWCEVGLSPEENIIKEVKEETGFDAKVNRIVKIISRTPNERYLYSSYHILFHCEIIGGKLEKSYESEEVAFMKFDEVTNWHYDHKEWIKSYLNAKT